MARYISTPFGSMYYDEEGKVSQFSSGYDTNPGFPLGEANAYEIGSVSGEFGSCTIKQYRDQGDNVVKWTGDKSGIAYNGGVIVEGKIYIMMGIDKPDATTYRVWYMQTNKINIGDDFLDEDLMSTGGAFYNYNAQLLFSGTAEEIFKDDDDWEEPVDPGYNPSESQGGVDADTENLFSEDIDFGFLDPIDPNAETPTDDPDNVNNHNDSYFRLMQPYLLSGTKWTNFQDLYWYNVDQSGSFWQNLLRTVFEGVSDPLSAIGGLIRLPLSPGTIQLSGSGNMYLGGLPVTDGNRTASAYYIANRYARISYGLRLKETFGTYYDYTQTDVQLYLPYVNTVSLDVSTIMDSTMVITYIIDVYTGDLLCTLNVNKTVHGQSLNSIIGRWKGNCAMNTIYSRANTQQHMQNMVNGAMGVAGNLMGGNIMGVLGGTLNTMMDQKIKTEKIGNISGDSGWMDIQVPYLIIKRNVPMYPDEWRNIKGAQQNATFSVSELSGYTEFEEIHVHVGGATDEENAEIESILKSGIII